MRYAALAVAVLLCLSVVAFAAGSVPPHSVVEDGDTYLRTFILAGNSADMIAYFNELLVDPRCVLVYGVSPTYPLGVYSFFRVPQGSEIVLKNDTVTQDSLLVDISPSSQIRVLSFVRNGENFNLVDDVSCYGISGVKNLVGGNYWAGYKVPPLATDYIATLTGRLFIITDQGSSDVGGGEEEGILGWLAGFWQKFVDTLKWLFIPSPDYFPNFFDEIKIAFEQKLGGLGNLLTSVSDLFSSLKNVSGESSLVIKVPDNQFFAGYEGLTVNAFKHIKPLIDFIRGVINAFLVVVTIIVCYKKLISIIKI